MKTHTDYLSSTDPGKDAAGPSPRYRYRAFISYCHTDDAEARWLLRKLENYKIPSHLAGKTGRLGLIPERLAPIFRDRDEMASSADLSGRIASALKDSESLIVIASPASAKSMYVNEEVLAFKRLGRSENIHCLIIAGDPASDIEQCFCPALRFAANPDGSLSDNPVEPVAADARTSGDGKARALTKLIAGLLGVDFDDLFQREVARRHQRLMSITISAVAATAITAALLVVAVLARDDAERRREQAEDLIGFMVGDLYEKLYEIDRIDVFNVIGNKTLEYFESLERDDLTDSMLAQRAESLRKIGEVRLDQGQMESALDAFNLALEISGRLVAKHPQKVDRKIELAETYYWIGAVQWRRGDLPGAADAFAAQMATQHDAAGYAPENAELIRDLGYSNTNLGRIEERLGNLPKALEYYREVLRFNEQYAELTDNSDDAMIEVGYANNNLGKLAMTMGQLVAAKDHFLRDYQIKKRISNANPQNEMARWDLASSERFLGLAYEYLGKNLQSEPLYEKALGITEARLLEEPDAHSRVLQNAIVSRTFSDFLVRQGEYQKALLVAGAAIESMTERLADHLSDQKWQLELAGLQKVGARAAMNTGDKATANELSLKSLETLQDLTEASPQPAHILGMLIEARNIRSDVLLLMDYKNKADSLREKSLQEFSDLMASTRDPDLLASFLTAARDGEENDEYVLLLQRLVDTGYRRSGALSAKLPAAQ